MKQFLFTLLLLSISVLGYSQHGYVHDKMYDKYGRENEAKGEDWMKNMMSGKVEPEYHFPVMMQMHMTSYKHGQPKDENDITYYFSTTSNILGMKPHNEKRKGEDMFIIYDHKSNSMVMLNETKKTGMAMNLNALMSADNMKKREAMNSGHSYNNKTDCKKTGKTKTIHGYTCYQYVCTNTEEHTRNEIWITKQLNFDISQSAARSGLGSYLGSVKGLGGMMMEGDFYKNDELEMKMEVTQINDHENLVIHTDQYKFGMQ